MTVRSSMLVGELDAAVYKFQGLPYKGGRFMGLIGPEWQRLYNNKSLASYGVSAGARLDYFYEQYGGMIHITSGREDLKDLDEVKEIISRGLVPIEVVLPDCSTVLLSVVYDGSLEDIKKRLVKALRKEEDVSVPGKLDDVRYARELDDTNFARELDAASNNNNNNVDYMRELLRQAQERIEKLAKKPATSKKRRRG